MNKLSKANRALVYRNAKRNDGATVTGNIALTAASIDHVSTLLVERLGTYQWRWSDVYLADGCAGVLVGLVELYNYRQDDRIAALIRDSIDQIVSRLPKLQSGVSLYHGLAGLSWAVNYAGRRLGYKELNLATDCTRSVDRTIADLIAAQRDLPFDLIQGLVGLGAWAIDLKDGRLSQQVLQCVIRRLRHKAESKDGGGVTWRTPTPHRSYQATATEQNSIDGTYDLGLAHGVPGVISLLGKALRHRVIAANEVDLLKSSIDWLLSTRKFGEVFSFPYRTGHHVGSRLAWCYGDLGVSIALAQGASGLDDRYLMDDAISVALHALNIDFSVSGVIDSGICHGGIGIAHIANEFYRATGDARFAAHRDRWIQQSLDLSRRLSTPTPFVAYGGPAIGYEVRLGFLTGVAGIGLALLDAAGFSTGYWNLPLLTRLET